MMRHVAISAVGAQMGGARRHLTGFVPALAALAPDWRFEIYVNTAVEAWLGQVPANVKLVPVAQADPGLWSRLRWDQVVLPRLAAQNGADLLVSLLNFGPISRSIPQINFQRNPIYYCPLYLNRVHVREKPEVVLRRWMCRWAMGASVRVVTPTAAMWKMIQGYFPRLPDQKYCVLPHAVDPVSGPSAPVSPGLAAKLENAPRPWMVYPSHAAPHKGFDVLLEAARRLHRDGCEFTLLLTIDERDWPQGVPRIVAEIGDLGLSHQVRILGRVSQTDMLSLYQLVDLVVFPSLCESFGFPLVEAMSYGRPVVASGTEVNQEVGRAGVVYYQPENPEDATRVLRAAMSEDWRSTMAERAQHRYAEFDWSWQRYVRDFASICAAVLDIGSDGF